MLRDKYVAYLSTVSCSYDGSVKSFIGFCKKSRLFFNELEQWEFLREEVYWKEFKKTNGILKVTENKTKESITFKTVFDLQSLELYTLIMEILVVAWGKRCYKILFVELEIRKGTSYID
jgi:hypothetical protein